MRIDVIKGPIAPLRRIDPARRVALLTAAQADANLRADEIVEAARREADRLIAAARSDAGRIAAQAHAEADREGARLWNAAALDLAQTREASIGTLEREALALAVEIARRIVRDFVAASPDAWADLVARCTDRLRRDARLVVRHATGDADRVSIVRDRLSAFRDVAFEPDESLDIGDCVAECAGVRVDARLDVQLAAIENLLVNPANSEDRT